MNTDHRGTPIGDNHPPTPQEALFMLRAAGQSTHPTAVAMRHSALSSFDRSASRNTAIQVLRMAGKSNSPQAANMRQEAITHLRKF